MEKKYLDSRKNKTSEDDGIEVENFYDIIEAAGAIKPDEKLLWK